MATETEKAIAKPLLAFSRDYILQLEAEVRCTVGDLIEGEKPIFP